MANPTNKPAADEPKEEEKTPSTSQEEQDRKLDEAIEETFPASDPISI